MNMKKIWLLFAQAVTVCVAILFVLTTLQPQWFNGQLLGMPVNAVATTSAATTPLPRVSVNTAPIASFAQAADRSSKAVVNVFTKQKRKRNNTFEGDPFFNFFFGLPRQQMQPEEEGTSLGSGVVVSTDVEGTTLVITNSHVIDQADSIELVLSDGRRAPATVVGTDPDTDIALLKMQLTHVPVIEWGDLADVRVGDAVLAVGNPFGVGQTVTQGIVSALGRNHVSGNTFENFIQTDAAINPGNSGGALTDSQGRLIGINTAIYSKDGGSLGIGFAIPVTTVKQVMTQLLKQGSVTRGYIGVTPMDVSEATQEKFNIPEEVTGSVIAMVQPNSPAAGAGFIVGDVVQQIDTAVIKDSAALLNAIANTPPNTVVAIQVWRAGNLVNLKVKVAKRPSRKQMQRELEE
jgi:serine protease DegQ